MKEDYIKIDGYKFSMELIKDFLSVLTKQLHPNSVIKIFKKIIYEEIKPKDILNIEHEKAETARYKKLYNNSNEAISRLDEANIILNKKMEENNTEISELLNSIRFYEEYMEGIGMRSEIIKRKDFGKLFEEDEEGWTA